MNKATSIYLDAVRFLAAVTVFLGHAAARSNTDGLFWQVVPLANTAVIVFFVLSGYVIAYVTATRESQAFVYAASRFGRLYSVALPAIFLTGICEYLVLPPEAYAYPNGAWDAVWRYFGISTFASQFWFLGNGEPLLNPPFWSLSYEVAYYVAAGFLIFGKGIGRIIGVAVVAAFAGPTIMALAPIWFLGYGAYYYSHRVRLGALPALTLYLVSFAVLVASPSLDGIRFADVKNFSASFDHLLPRIVSDYVGGIAFTVHLVAFHALASKAEPILVKYERFLRWLGSLTFVLYLFHYPLLKLFAFYGIGEPGSLRERIWVIGGTFLTISIVGPVLEGSKVYYRHALFAVRRMWTGPSASPSIP